MSDNSKPQITLDVPMEVADNNSKFPEHDSVQEMPTVTTLLQRKKLAIAQSPAPTSPAIHAPSSRSNTRVTLSQTNLRRHGEPPPFRGNLQIESLDLKSLGKALKRHKNSNSLRKLDCLGYLSAYFSEILFLEVQPQGQMKGILGFGNSRLVTDAKKVTAGVNQLPSIFSLLSESECFTGAVESLRSEDAAGLRALGLQALQSLGVFPVSRSKKVSGVWICGSAQTLDFPQKELKSLKKILSDLEL